MYECFRVCIYDSSLCACRLERANSPSNCGFYMKLIISNGDCTDIWYNKLHIDVNLRYHVSKSKLSMGDIFLG